MREILFRGKRIDNDEWIYGSFCMDACEQLGGLCGVDGFIRLYDLTDSKMQMFEVDRETVGQFTGLTDKNGTRIFEGDICRNTKTGEIISVAWHGTMAGFVWSKRKEKSHLFDFGELFRAYDKYEVIGNIHDNPELLEGERKDNG